MKERVCSIVHEAYARQKRGFFVKEAIQGVRNKPKKNVSFVSTEHPPAIREFNDRVYDPPPPRNPLPLSRHIHHHSSIAILQDSFKFHWHSYFILRKDTVVAQTSVTEVPWKHIPSDNSHMLFSWTMWNFLGSFTSRITNHLRLAETHFRLIGLQT